MIKLLTGTTEDYKAVEDILILDEREIAVEITSDESGVKYYNIRQGDGHSTFFDLPIIVNNQRYEVMNKNMAGYFDQIKKFSETMVANTTKAGEAATKAVEATKHITELTKGLNSMVDDETGVTYVLGIEAGIAYITDEVE